jgi:hypothetical protein
MIVDDAVPRLAVLAADPVRGQRLAEACSAALPCARVEHVRDMVDLTMRTAAGAADAAVIDGSSGDVFPEESVAVLKGLRASLCVVIVDARPGLRIPYSIDQLLEQSSLGNWLAQAFPTSTK